MLFLKKKKYWQEDKNYQFNIDDEVVTNYFNKTSSLVFSDDSARREEIAILPRINLTNKSKVLDLGCGNGRWGKILIPKCKEYVGIDLAKKFIDRANRRFKGKSARFVCMRAQDYLVEEKFDFILAIGLTTYMNDEDIEKMANNCKKMLADKGKLIIRSVTIKEPGVKRKVFNRKPDLIRKLLRRPAYQIIRRTVDEEMKFFHMFRLEHQEEIQDTGYTFCVLQ